LEKILFAATEEEDGGLGCDVSSDIGEKSVGEENRA
jgi:hypothetical protein